MRSARVIGLAAALFIGVGAAPARACINVHLSGGGNPTVNGPSNVVGPGDTVHFSISGLDKGAAWTVTLSGTGQTQTGVSDGGSVAGSFVVPDLGSGPRTLSLQGTATHEEVDGSFWPLGPIALSYQVPSAPPPASPPPPPPAVQPAPPAPTAATQPSHPPASATPQSPSASGGPGAAPPTPGGPTLHRGGGSTSGPGEGSEPQQPRGNPRRRVHAATGAAARTPGQLHTRHARRPAPAPHRAAAPAARPPSAVPSAFPRRAPGHGHGHEIPWAAVLLAALAVLAAGSAAGGLLLIRRRRPRDEPPSARELALEAELQEIVAEERAQRLSDGDKVAERLPAER